MSTVIVAEKPSVGREIAALLGAGVKGDGYLQTRDGKRIVTWAFGHLVRYAEPHEYGEAWSGRWNLQDLPMVPDTWLTKVQGESAGQFRTVSRLMNHAERVICATDAGREGEHIFRLIYERAGCTAPVERLWVSSLTREALKQGFMNLRPGSDFDPLGEAAQGRAKADWLVGFNLTRAYSAKHRTKLSVGRVADADAGPRRRARPADRGVQSVTLLRGGCASGARLRCRPRAKGGTGRQGTGALGAAHRRAGGGRRGCGGGVRRPRGGGGGRGQPHGAPAAAGAVRPDGAAARGQPSASAGRRRRPWRRRRRCTRRRRSPTRARNAATCPTTCGRTWPACWNRCSTGAPPSPSPTCGGEGTGSRTRISSTARS